MLIALLQRDAAYETSLYQQQVVAAGAYISAAGQIHERMLPFFRDASDENALAELKKGSKRACRACAN